MQVKLGWISEDRLRPYVDETFGAQDKALELYDLDRRLSASLFYDISFLEVALRNSINRYLSEKYGEDWYSKMEVGFDERVRENLSESWDSLPRSYTSKHAVRSKKLGGRLIAASMFRTWTNMLDSGGSSGLPEPFDKANHDNIWSTAALREVFPGAYQLAKRKYTNFQSKGLNRAWVYEKVYPVRQVRNRIAHHESLTLRGVPIPGRNARLTVFDCHVACLDLAEMLDHDLLAFLEKSPTQALLGKLREFESSLVNQ